MNDEQTERVEAAAKLFRLAQRQEMMFGHERKRPIPLDQRGKVQPSQEAFDRVIRGHPDLVKKAGPP
jgi:hypothetical protein